ncbi:unnamed protein product [Prunus brigantina]
MLQSLKLFLSTLVQLETSPIAHRDWEDYLTLASNQVKELRDTLNQYHTSVDLAQVLSLHFCNMSKVSNPRLRQ